MRGSRRPRRTRDVYSFERADWRAPPNILIDTSVVVGAILPNEAHHVACAQLLTRLAGSASVLVRTPLLEPELCEALYRIALAERWGKQKARSMRNDGRARQRANRLLEQGLSAWRGILGSLKHAVITFDDDLDRLQGLIGLGVGSYDACHIGAGIASGVVDIATVDHGFALVPEETVRLHVPSELTGSMRRRRG